MLFVFTLFEIYRSLLCESPLSLGSAKLAREHPESDKHPARCVYVSGRCVGVPVKGELCWRRISCRPRVLFSLSLLPSTLSLVQGLSLFRAVSRVLYTRPQEDIATVERPSPYLRNPKFLAPQKENIRQRLDQGLIEHACKRSKYISKTWRRHLDFCAENMCNLRSHVLIT